jgi:hypothetical protein
MIVKIFHEYLSQSTPNNLKEEDKINMFAGQKGVVIHDIKYEKIRNGQMQHMIAFVQVLLSTTLNMNASVNFTKKFMTLSIQQEYFVT